MSTVNRVSSGRTNFEVRWNWRSCWWNVAFMFALFLGCVALAVLDTDGVSFVGVAGAVIWGGAMGFLAVAGAKQLRQRPVAITLNEFGVTFDGQDPVAWETLREVRFGRVKPPWLSLVHPRYYVAFVPKRSADLRSLTPRKRKSIRMYGTTLLVMTQTVTINGDDILAAVERMSDVPIRR